MSTRKIILFASMVLGLMAFALPASAMAEDTITDNGPLINKIIKFEGKAKFETLATGIECTVTLELKVNIDEITVVNFVVNTTPAPAAGCNFFGAVYKECEFEQHPVADNLNLAELKLDTKTPNGEHFLTVVTGTKDQAHPVLTSELKTRTGAPNTCNVTTQDITVVSEASANLTLDIETDVNKFISAVQLTGQIRIDRGTPAEMTKTPSSVNNLLVGLAGTLKIEEPGTYNVSGS